MEKKQFNNLYTTKNVPERLITCGGVPAEYHITKTVAQDQESEIKTHYDCYENSVFSWRTWSAPILFSPVELKKRLDSFKLEGRKIADLKLVGLNYCLQSYHLESLLLKETDDAEQIIDYEAPIGIYAEIDEPLLIRFEDGDVLEMLEETDGEHRVSMNRIPWDIKAGTNFPNIDASAFFKDCIGRTITAVELHICDLSERENYFQPWNPAESQTDFVKNIILRFDDGNGLKFSGWIDFCNVDYVDCNNEYVMKPFKEIAPAYYDLDRVLKDLLSDE